ncbi:unnamed protein product [Caenorhabditis bovis]|nr:unnamed protein product [Caenorhabditis bovis]
MCLTTLKTASCLNSTQFSYQFWRFAEKSQCVFDDFAPTNCSPPFLRGNLCENVVKFVKSSENFTFFELYKSNCFQIEHLIKSALSIPENSTICNCLDDAHQNCDRNLIVIASGPIRRNSSCVLPTTADFQLTEANGYITSAVVIWSDFADVTDDGFDIITLRKNVIFQIAVLGEPKSIFASKRGRFHCPSETSCILEILYPFTYFTTFDTSHQIAIAFIIALIAVNFRS